MDTKTKTVNVENLKKGDRLVRAAYRKPTGCAGLGLAICNHAACTEPETAYEVTGKRRAPKGTRVHLRHPYGSGCAVVADADGFLSAGWTVAP